MQRYWVWLCLVSMFLAGASAQSGPKSLVIGIDGLGSFGLEAAATPSIDSLINGTFGGGAYHGSYSFQAFAGGVLGTATQQPTVSGPGWSTIHTGVWADRHGVVDNGASFTNGNFAANPSYLETLEEGLPSVYTASVVNWSPIDSTIVATVDDENSAMNFRATPGNDAQVTSVAATRLANLNTNEPAAVFVQFDEVDGAGHASGAWSPGYVAQVAETDARVGTLLTTIANRPNFAAENWQIIVTSDHGHTSSGGHGGQSALERTIPLVVASKQAAGGPLAANTQQPSHADIAPTVLAHFGVEAPSYYAGQVRGSEALAMADLDLTVGLLSHLPFDGNASAGAAGGGGSSFGAVDYVPGRFGSAASVANYGDGFVRLNDDIGALVGAPTDFSMSLWVRYDGFSSDPAFLSNKDWSSGGNTGINLAFNPDNTLDFNTKSVGGPRQDLHPFEALEPGRWQNIVFTVDRDGPTTLYVDGALMGQIAATSQGSFDGSFAWTLLSDGTGAYGFGSETSGLAVDEFAAWGRLLSLDEITALANRAIVRTLGDANGDGLVSGADYTIWADHFGAGPGARFSQGDFNGDGFVSGADYTIWADHFGEDSFNTHTVPEPSTAIFSLVTLGVVAMRQSLARRRPRRMGAHTRRSTTCVQ